MGNKFNQRIETLRNEMKREGIDFYLLSSTDPHSSEYVSDYFKATEFLTGCTSDNVVLIISDDDAKLWTDSRYHISAGIELEGSGVTLMKDGLAGVISAADYLRDVCKEKGCTLGFDGSCVSAQEGLKYESIAKGSGATCLGDVDLIKDIWAERPELPANPVWVFGESYCGKSFKEKLSEVRQHMAKSGAESLVLSKLDDIMYLTNLRGSDIECNPVALSYAVVTGDEFNLFIQKKALDDDVLNYLEDGGVSVFDYEEFFARLSELRTDSVMIEQSAVCFKIYDILRKSAGRIVEKTNPTTLMKAVKNAKETEFLRVCYLNDSVALCKFIYKIKKWANDPDSEAMTECDAADLIDSMRADVPGFMGLSFGTISAYGANAAMAHYSPVRGEDAEIKKEGFLLVDSGGQYMTGTTDVTRTIAVGPLSEEMKRDFTLVAAGNLRLLSAVFKNGTCGGQLDLLAREPMWSFGIDYGHGTGHGIGFFMNVHEGPQRIAPHKAGTSTGVAMECGMLTSDEPGIYREGEYGIRTESIVLTVPYGENEFGSFLQFECLTYAPIDLDAIDINYMDSGDVARLNVYHEEVYKKVAPHLNEEEAAWLYDVTRPIEFAQMN